MIADDMIMIYIFPFLCLSQNITAFEFYVNICWLGLSCGSIQIANSLLKLLNERLMATFQYERVYRQCFLGLIHSWSSLTNGQRDVSHPLKYSWSLKFSLLIETQLSTALYTVNYYYTVIWRDINCNKTSLTLPVTMDMARLRCPGPTSIKTVHIWIDGIPTLTLITQSYAKAQSKFDAFDKWFLKLEAASWQLSSFCQP